MSIFEKAQHRILQTEFDYQCLEAHLSQTKWWQLIRKVSLRIQIARQAQKIEDAKREFRRLYN